MTTIALKKILEKYHEYDDDSLGFSDDEDGDIEDQLTGSNYHYDYVDLSVIKKTQTQQFNRRCH